MGKRVERGIRTVGAARPSYHSTKHMIGGDRSIRNVSVGLWCINEPNFCEACEASWSIRWTCVEDARRSQLWALWTWTVFGFPLSWAKTQGGSRAQWIGYDVWIKEHSLGITEARAASVVSWARKVINDRATTVNDFETGVGKLSFCCGVLEYERPFLAPCYNFLARLIKQSITVGAAARGVKRMRPSATQNSAIRPLPLYVACALSFLAARIEQRRVYPSASRRVDTDFCPRVDARADGKTAMLGGWLLTRDSTGKLSKATSPWFSVELTELTAPWAYYKGLPFKTIAALEAMATLLAVVAFSEHIPREANAHVVMRSVTDNQGNERALSKLSSTKFPLSVVSMELAAQMEAKGLRIEMQWAPREHNQEADDLSNGVTSGFVPGLRKLKSFSEIKWVVLDELMRFGLEFHAGRSCIS